MRSNERQQEWTIFFEKLGHEKQEIHSSFLDFLRSNEINVLFSSWEAFRYPKRMVRVLHIFSLLNSVSPVPSVVLPVTQLVVTHHPCDNFFRKEEGHLTGRGSK